MTLECKKNLIKKNNYIVFLPLDAQGSRYLLQKKRFEENPRKGLLVRLTR